MLPARTRAQPVPNTRASLLVLGLLASLLAFVALADEIRERQNLPWDGALVHLAQTDGTPLFEWLARFFSALGSSTGLALLAAAAGLVLLAERRRGDAAFIAAALLGVGPLVAALKDALQRPRPAVWETLTPDHSFAFPSAHAAASATLAAVLVVVAWRTAWRWPAVAGGLAFALGVGASRVYLGAHFPSDVIAGWCVAAVWTLTLVLLWQHAPRRLLFRRQ